MIKINKNKDSFLKIHTWNFEPIPTSPLKYRKKQGIAIYLNYIYKYNCLKNFP